MNLFQTFKEGYGVLKKNAELLESHEEPDIDNLMKFIEESIEAMD
jgi:exodeoxyribonuclease VII small subunit